jgi:hypothetical protein
MPSAAAFKLHSRMRTGTCKLARSCARCDVRYVLAPHARACTTSCSAVRVLNGLVDRRCVVQLKAEVGALRAEIRAMQAEIAPPQCHSHWPCRAHRGTQRVTARLLSRYRRTVWRHSLQHGPPPRGATHTHAHTLWAASFTVACTRRLCGSPVCHGLGPSLVSLTHTIAILPVLATTTTTTTTHDSTFVPSVFVHRAGDASGRSLAALRPQEQSGRSTAAGRPVQPPGTHCLCRCSHTLLRLQRHHR